MKRTTSIAIAVVMILWVCSVVGQTTAPATPQNAPATTTPAASAKGDGDRPLQVSFGPEDGGGFGLTAKGSAYRPILGSLLQHPHPKHPEYSISSFVYLAPDANFSVGSTKTNQAAISLRPALQLGYQPQTTFNNYPATRLTPWPQAAPFATLYADVRRQYGEFPDANGANVPYDSTLVGGGASIAVPYFTRFVEMNTTPAPGFDPFAVPMIHLVWYHVVNHKSALQLPDGITADQIDAALKTSYTFGPWTRGSSTVVPRFDFDGDLSRPTAGASRKWKSKIDVALSGKFNDNSFRPIIAYTSGQKNGLKYDRQVLLGLALEWLGGKKQ